MLTGILPLINTVLKVKRECVTEFEKDKESEGEMYLLHNTNGRTFHSYFIAM